MSMQAPETLNGYPVIASAVHRNCVTIMCKRHNPALPYVVATWWPDLGSTWSWGHYKSDIDAANSAFSEAKARNHNR